MGKKRTCDSRCHEAREPACRCWCGGLFHGAKGKAAREAFAETFTELATTEREFLEHVGQRDLFREADGAWWCEALAHAQAAAGAAFEPRSERPAAAGA